MQGGAALGKREAVSTKSLVVYAQLTMTAPPPRPPARPSAWSAQLQKLDLSAPLISCADYCATYGCMTLAQALKSATCAVPSKAPNYCTRLK